MTLEQICDWIVLFGAVTLAITNIIKFFKTPVKGAKNKSEDYIKSVIKTELDIRLPIYFDECEQAAYQKYLSQRSAYINEIQNEVLNNVSAPLNEIKAMLEQQMASIEVLKQGTKDVLRQKIMAIYHEYKSERAFPIHVKEALDELYKDYKKEGGNSYIDKYYGRMGKWKITYPDGDNLNTELQRARSARIKLSQKER